MPISPLLLRINGLPAHPLVVHGAVVFVPLAVAAALGYLVPRWRDRLRWPLLVTALLALAFVWAAYLTGVNFRDSGFQNNPQVARHEDYANVLRWLTSGFAVLAVAITLWLHGRPGAPRTALRLALAALALVTLVYVFLTGEAGAKAVYPLAASSQSGAPVSTR